MSPRRRLARALAALSGALAVLAGGTGFASADDAPREVVLVLDASGSMTAAEFGSARSAAVEFAEAVPADVRIGLVTFSDKPRLVVRPTTDIRALEAGLDSARSGGATALYDAVRLGASTMDGAAERRLVVMTDGVDTRSRSDLGATVRALSDGHVVADVIAYRHGSDNMAAMRKLAVGGRVLAADDAVSLADAFASVAHSHRDDVASGYGFTWQLAVIALLSFVSVLSVVLAVFLGPSRRDERSKSVLEQIDRYGPQAKPATVKEQGSAFVRGAVNATEEFLQSRGWEEKLAERLDLASIRLKPAEWTILRGCAVVVAAALLLVVGVFWWLAIPAALALGWGVTWLIVRLRVGKRRREFGDQLPDMLQLVAGSLQSGFSLAQALDSVVREGTEPASGEISRALAESRIGVELEDALDRVAARMASSDLTWIVMAIRIQREVGGNLAEVLLTTVKTMRERAQMRRHVRALSAEGRLSAYVLLGLPVGLAAFFFLARPEYMRPLYTTGPGIVMIVSALLAMTVGSFWMSRLIKVEV